MVANVIAERIALSGLDASTVEIQPLVRFIELMAKWNRHINLTALPLAPPSHEAIDRLIVEPVAASRIIDFLPRAIADIGSGGGSPAIPFRLQFPSASLTMFESRTKKCAFLREAVRSLEIGRSQVVEARFEDVNAQEVTPVDLVTMRAVKLDEISARLIRAISEPGAKVLRFTSETGDKWSELEAAKYGMTLLVERQLVASTRSSIQLFHVER